MVCLQRNAGAGFTDNREAPADQTNRNQEESKAPQFQQLVLGGQVAMGSLVVGCNKARLKDDRGLLNDGMRRRNEAIKTP